MSDIVGFLQHIAEHCGLSDADRRCIREAAAEIVRLRAALDLHEARQVEFDAFTYGIGYMKDGKRIDPFEVVKNEPAGSTAPADPYSPLNWMTKYLNGINKKDGGRDRD